MATETYQYKVRTEEFKEFLEHLTVLNAHHTVQKLKVSPDGIVFYSAISDSNESTKLQSVRVFFIENGNFYQRIPEGIRYTIKDSKEFLKQFNFIAKETSEQVDITLAYNDRNKAVTSLKAATEGLELKAIAGDDDPRLIKDIEIGPMRRVMNPEAGIWKVDIDVETLAKVKALSKIDDEKIITLRIKDGEVFLSQHKWRQKLPVRVEHPNGEWVFTKANFLTIKEYGEPITLSMFPSFVLIDEKKSFFMFSLELQS